MEALNALLDDFAAQGGSKTINVVACYRTAEEQQHLFDQSAERSGLDHAEKYVAQPGGSEHHTALVVDLSVLNSDGTSSEYDGDRGVRLDQRELPELWLGGPLRPGQGGAHRPSTTSPGTSAMWASPTPTKMAELDLCLEEYIDYLKDFTFEGDHLTIGLRLRTVRGLVRPGDEDLPPRRRGVHRLRQQCGRPDRHVQGGVMAVEQTFSVTYARCGFCAAKKPLRRLCGGAERPPCPPVMGVVAAARVELPAGRAVVDHDLSLGDLEDLLDRRGLLMGEPIDK